MEPNKRNAKESSVTTSFHLSWSEETFFKSKKRFKISQTCFAARPRVQINSSRWSERSEFLDHFCSHFIGRGVTNRSKSWIQLWSNMYITVFVFLSPGSCLKVLDLYSNLTWKRNDRHVFTAVEGWKNSSPEGFEDSVLLDLPFWDHLNINLYFSVLF